jgi:hypothetical protein
MLKLTKSSHQRGTVVLATGDGAVGSHNEGFRVCLKTCLSTDTRSSCFRGEGR